MLPYLRATLLAALRSPGAWLVLVLGCGSLAIGLGLAVLAFEGDRRAEVELIAECAAGVAAGVALWILATALARDRVEGFALAADQTAAGASGRLLGRWAGASLASSLAAGLVLGLGQLLAPGDGVESISLLYTSICSGGLMGAWALLLSGFGLGPAAALLAGLGLWILGHLPWAAPGYALGGAGAWVGALLPAAALDLRSATAALLALVGLLALVLALRSRVEGRWESGPG